VPRPGPPAPSGPLDAADSQQDHTADSSSRQYPQDWQAPEPQTVPSSRTERGQGWPVGVSYRRSTPAAQPGVKVMARSSAATGAPA